MYRSKLRFFSIIIINNLFESNSKSNQRRNYFFILSNEKKIYIHSNDYLEAIQLIVHPFIFIIL